MAPATVEKRGGALMPRAAGGQPAGGRGDR